MDAELKMYLDAIRHEMVKLNADTNQRMEQLIAQTQILMEAVRHDVRGVADGVIQVEAKLDRVYTDHERRLTRLEERIG
ncbi:MAG: hypothetical protein ACYCOU_17830 [Sulfobacillus sp.]